MLKSIAKQMVRGVAFLGLATVTAPLLVGAAIAFSIALTDKQSRKQHPHPSDQESHQPGDSTLESAEIDTKNTVSQKQVNEALWLQIQAKYSPVKSWQQQILETIPALPPLPLEVTEEKELSENERSLPEVIISTPFPKKPDDFSDEKKWTVRRLQDLCRKLNAIEQQSNPQNPYKIIGYASKGTNRRNIVRLINKFYKEHVSQAS
jgi:hypothetical protein